MTVPARGAQFAPLAVPTTTAPPALLVPLPIDALPDPAPFVQVRTAARIQAPATAPNQVLKVTLTVSTADLESAGFDRSRLRIAAVDRESGRYLVLPAVAAPSGAVAALAPSAVDVALVALGDRSGPPDYELADGSGHFFTQGTDVSGRAGFAIVDRPQAPMWLETRRMGGTDRLGYPIGHGTELEGRTVQLFQHAAVEWRPELGRANVLPLLDRLSSAGHDPELLSRWQIPERQNTTALAVCAGELGCVTTRHLAMVDPDRPTNLDGTPIRNVDRTALAALRRYITANPEWPILYGLPTGVAQFENSVVLRTDRVAIRYWLRDTAGARRGDVVSVNVGEISRDLGFWPVQTISPEIPTDPAPATSVRGNVGVL